MSSLHNLIDMHAATGLYSLGEGSNVMNELKAYAAGLDMLQNTFDSLIKEAFVNTAEGIGLSFWEKKLELSSLEDDTAARRRRLMALLSLTDGSFRKSDLISLLSALGSDVTIEEDFENEAISITGKGYIGVHDSTDDIIAEFNEILPAHLGYSINISIGTWYYWDNQGKTFSEWEQLGSSFADFSETVILSREIGMSQ